MYAFGVMLLQKIQQRDFSTKCKENIFCSDWYRKRKLAVAII